MADFKRRIRIEGKPDETKGYMMDLRDADTGEAIPGVKSLVVYLDASAHNQAEITSYELGENGGVTCREDGSIIMNVATSNNPEIAVTAFERLDKQSEAEHLAQLFHETYERLSPSHGYRTSGNRALPWSRVDERQKQLMTAVATEVLIAMNGDPHLNLEDFITKPLNKLDLVKVETGKDDELLFIAKPLSIEEQMAPMYEVEEPWPHIVDDGRGGHLVHRENEL